jgi:hypothetical protein
MIDPTAAASDEGRVVRTLKEGYWDRIEVVERVDGTLRVRKSTRPDAPQGPWGITALRLEIRYLETLPERARGAFPPLLVCWDDSHALPPRVGYEVPFYPDHDDAGHLARTGALTQPQVDDFQDRLAEILFEQVHAPLIQQVHAPLTGGGTSLSAHVASAIEHALELLEKEPPLEQLVGAETIELDGKPRWGTRAALARAVRRAETLRALDAAPQVRLHGDFFLENILFRRAASELGPQLLLIDPVSVAGVSEGSPLFDLVKYESYATGELFALRKGLVDVSGFEGGRVYRSSVRWEDPELASFRLRDWHSRFRSRFNERYGASDRGAYHLLEGYFGVVMAVNTNGQQRRARLLRATRAFNLAADNAPTDNAPADNA